MEIDEALSNSASVETDVNMQDAKDPSNVCGAKNGGMEAGDRPVQMDMDAKVCNYLLEKHCVLFLIEFSI